jgi:hypothetical protein
VEPALRVRGRQGLAQGIEIRGVSEGEVVCGVHTNVFSFDLVQK